MYVCMQSGQQGCLGKQQADARLVTIWQAAMVVCKNKLQVSILNRTKKTPSKKSTVQRKQSTRHARFSAQSAAPRAAILLLNLPTAAHSIYAASPDNVRFSPPKACLKRLVLLEATAS